MAQANIEESFDRISSLPDSVLGHILSFLPTKVAVSGCIFLNRSRWRDIFPFSTNLDFDESLVISPYLYNRTDLFMDFVDRCIMLMNGKHIDKLRLKCSFCVDTSRIHSWICAAPFSNVRELDLSIGSRERDKEYSHVLTRSTLVVLKLGIGVSLNVTASLHFPCLKILCLEPIRLARNDSLIQRLVSSCPVLEDLSISRCYMENEPVLSLSSPSLKRLTIDKPYGFRPYKLVLDAPSLVYLEFAVCVREGHILKNQRSLREARIDITFWFKGRIDHHQLLAGLGNVESLYLSGKVQKFLPKTLDVSEKLPRLKNVTRLVLTGRPYMEMSEVIQLFEYSPNLEEFVTDGSIEGGYDVPCCVPSRLKSIQCSYIGGMSKHRQEKSLEYFLKNADVLEKMRIDLPWYCSDTHGEVVEKLEKMMVTMNELAKAPSRSKTCEINVFLSGERVIFSK